MGKPTLVTSPPKWSSGAAWTGPGSSPCARGILQEPCNWSVPRASSRLPRLGGDNFAKPENPPIVNSVRLVLPELGLLSWRERSMKAGDPRTDAYRRSGRNSRRGLVVPEEAPFNEMPERSPAQSSRRNGRGDRSYQRSGRPYKRDRRLRRRYSSRSSESSYGSLIAQFRGGRFVGVWVTTFSG